MAVFPCENLSASSTAVWSTWNQAACSTIATTALVWREWAFVQAPTSTSFSVGTACAPPTETPEQVAARQEAHRLRLEEQGRVQAALLELSRAEVERARAAQALAEALLKEHLDEVQRKELEEHKHFHVVAQDGKRFRLKYSTHGNVLELNEQDVPVASWCGQPEGVPTGDAVLAQKLMLETDVEAFRRIANRTRLIHGW